MRQTGFEPVTFGSGGRRRTLMGAHWRSLALIFKLAFAYEHGTKHRKPPEGYPSLLTDSGEQ